MHTKQTNKVLFDLFLPEGECVVPVTNGTPTQEHDEVRDGDDDDDDDDDDGNDDGGDDADDDDTHAETIN